MQSYNGLASTTERALAFGLVEHLALLKDTYN